MRYRFDQFEFDAARHELRRGGQPVELQPKVLDVLLFLVEHPGRTLSKDEILRAVWPGVATTEASLVRCVHLLRKELVGRDGDELIRTVRGRGYAMAVAVEVADERAEDGDGEAGSAAEKRPGARGRLLILAAVLPSLGLLALVALPSAERSAAPPEFGGTSIAVLPLLDLSAERDQGHLADGVALALADRVAAVRGVDLLSPRISFRDRDAQDDPLRVAGALGVDWIATGTLRRLRERIEVRVELIDARSGTLHWSQSYSYPESEHMAAQERIAEELARILDPLAALPDAASPQLPRSLTAYEFYLRGLRAALDAERDELRIAISHYQRAVEIDPAYVAGYVALANSYYEFWHSHDADDAAAGLLAAAEAAARRALELAPDDHHALTALAKLRLAKRDWEDSEASYRKAFEVGESPIAHRDYAGLLMMLGRLDEARPHIDRMLELEPLSARNQRAAGRFHLYRGEYAQTIPHLEKSLQLDPTEPFSPRLLASAHHYLGNDGASLDAFLRRVPAWLRTPLRAWDGVRGPGGALRLALQLDALRVGNPCGEDPQGSAIAWAHLEEVESMYTCLEKAASRHLWYVQVEPVYAAYRDSPRFAEVLARGGFPPPKVALH